MLHPRSKHIRKLSGAILSLFCSAFSTRLLIGRESYISMHPITIDLFTKHAILLPQKLIAKSQAACRFSYLLACNA